MSDAIEKARNSLIRWLSMAKRRQPMNETAVMKSIDNLIIAHLAARPEIATGEEFFEAVRRALANRCNPLTNLYFAIEKAVWKEINRRALK